jgi:hypothetical protein
MWVVITSIFQEGQGVDIFLNYLVGVKTTQAASEAKRDGTLFIP